MTILEAHEAACGADILAVHFHWLGQDVGDTSLAKHVLDHGHGRVKALVEGTETGAVSGDPQRSFANALDGLNRVDYFQHAEHYLRSMDHAD